MLWILRRFCTVIEMPTRVGVHFQLHVPFAGPKYPTAGIALYGTPSASAVFRYTVFPHQSGKVAPGYEMQKKMTMPLSARPVSSAAARM